MQANVLAALKDAGLHFGEIVADGKFHRARKPNDAQWCIANGGKTSTGKDWLQVSAGDFRETCGEYEATFTWRSWSRAGLAAQELAEIRSQSRRAKKATDLAFSEKHETSRQEAMRWWRKAAPADHPYLDKKLLPRGNTRRYGDWLLVPMYDPEGPFMGIQGIGADGTKKFYPGMRARGAYHPVTPGHFEGRWLLAEGWATAYALALTQREHTCACFSGGNLVTVASAMKRSNPQVEIVVCGDNDWETERRSGRNLGREAARKAAEATGGRWLVPDFSDFGNPKGATDFHDLAVLEGLL